MLDEEWCYLKNNNSRLTKSTSFDFLTDEVAKTVRRFHQGIEDYKTTPLITLQQLALELNVDGIYIKDESSVIYLDSFKILGASFAIFKLLYKTLISNSEPTSFADLKKLPKDKFTLVTATDGNFGKAVAWVAQQLRQKAIVYVPHTMTMHRRNAIELLGAKVLEPQGEDRSYDGAVHELATYPDKDNYLVISDTSWMGYEEIPKSVMQGYLTICDEATEQLGGLGIKKPSHIFLQVGVGGFAASVLGYYHSVFGNDRPISILVEPAAAACALQSAKNERRTKVETKNTIMVGLCCGEPSTLAWPILHNYADYFSSIPDRVASYGVKILAEPKPSDKAIISGESGAAGLGCLIHILRHNRDFAKKLGISSKSTILLFNTEGATDNTCIK
ncbi:diaminopropionate ammonia-lyase [Chloroflexota bacterium]